MKKSLHHYFQESITLHKAIAGDSNLLDTLSKVIAAVSMCFSKGHKLLIAGNGGSAADAQHFATEFVGRLRKERKGYPAIALSADGTFLTAWSNDYDFRSVFARQVEALG